MSLRKHRIHQDIKELVLRLPWWVGLFCALTSYLLLRPLATLRPAGSNGTPDTAFSAFAQLAAGVAAATQYLLPLAFLGLAAVSAFLQWKRRDLRASLAFDPGGAGLRSLGREDATFLAASAFRSRGFAVRDAEEVARRNGFDFQLDRGDERLLLQSRNWKSSAFDAAPLASLFDALQRFRADRAVVLISGRFTADALAFAADKPIDLIDGRGLKDLVVTHQAAPLAVVASRFRSWLDGRHGGAAIPNPSASAGRTRHDDGAGAAAADEQALGEALTALIRGESGSHDNTVRVAPRVPRAAPQTSEPALGTAGLPLLERVRAPIRIGRVANLVGMILALGLSWITYEWFDALPVSPAGTPWALLGRDNEPPVAGYAELASGVVSGQKALPPLGQLDYGPDPTALLASRWGRGSAYGGQPGIGGFRSIGELEDAFDAMYSPPPTCLDVSSPDGLASCGNHRIRARRAFIASNGRTMTPEPPAPSYDSEWISPESGAAVSWGAGADHWRAAGGDAEDQAADNGRGWPPEPSGEGTWPTAYTDTQAGDPAGRNRPGWPREEGLGDDGWQASGSDPGAWSAPSRVVESAARTSRAWPDGSDWSEGGQPDGRWRRGTFSDAYPGSEPTDDWRRDSPPRVRRLPIDEWLPNDPPSVRSWRDEEQAGDRRMQDDSSGWSQGSAGGTSDWVSPQRGGASTEPAPDWREDWMRRD